MDESRRFASRPIVVAAPFSPEGSGTNEHLGAANKIRAVLRILGRSGRRIVLVNSAHNAERFAGARRVTGADGPGVDTMVPFTLPSRPAGKLANILWAGRYARALAKENPALVWVYNGYAFDALIGLALARESGCALALEIEDWPTARGRGINPKPYLDLMGLKKTLRRASLVTCVNKPLADRVARSGVETMLLPGTLAPELTGGTRPAAPFSREAFTLGYFGGLTPEKGADVVLEAARDLPPGWNLTVCGSGTLRDDFAAASRSNSRILFYEGLGPDRLYPLVLGCDAIVNPHRPIETLKSGVFPFKVFEALAADALLISTKLPDPGVPLGGVMWFDGTAAALLAALSGAKRHFLHHANEITATANMVRERFSDAAIYDALSSRLPALSNTDRQIGP